LFSPAILMAGSFISPFIGGVISFYHPLALRSINEGWVGRILVFFDTD